jgi:fatty acid desaturase
MTVSVFSAIWRSAARTFRGEEELWKVWWLAGIPVALITGALWIAADYFRGLGAWAWGWGDACDVARLVVYLTWLKPVWRCSRNVQNIAWTPLARGALLVGLVLSVIF